MLRKIVPIAVLMLLLLREVTAGAGPPAATEPENEIDGLTSPHTLTLVAGKEALLVLRHPYRSISFGNSQVVAVTPLLWKNNQILVTGKAPGVTNLLIVEDESTLPMIDVIVTPAPEIGSAVQPRTVAPPAAVPAALSPLFNPPNFWIAVTILPLVSLTAFLEPLMRRGKGRLMVMTWIWAWFAIGQICFASAAVFGGRT